MESSDDWYHSGSGFIISLVYVKVSSGSFGPLGERVFAWCANVLPHLWPDIIPSLSGQRKYRSTANMNIIIYKTFTDIKSDTNIRGNKPGGRSCGQTQTHTQTPKVPKTQLAILAFHLTHNDTFQHLTSWIFQPHRHWSGHKKHVKMKNKAC